MLEVVRMGMERREQIVAVWSDAFAQDPVMCWLFPDPDTRPEALSRLWRFIMGHLPKGAELHGTRSDGCAALWHPPRPSARPAASDASGDSEGFLEFQALLRDYLGGLTDSRLAGLAKFEESRPAEPHWYLDVLGTRSAQQGRGLGTQVIAPMLARCDRMGLPAHLVSSNPQNVPFYLRHGFSVTRPLQVDDELTVTLMWRTPGAGS